MRNPVISDEESTDKCVEELSSAIQNALAATDPKHRPSAGHGPLYPPKLGTKYALKFD
jgi:hypothetical protein